MLLGDTVKLFSTEVFTDVFNPGSTFVGKINPFSEVANSGASSQRRILETAPDVSIPSDRVIQAPSEEIFIVANFNTDYWSGSVIRNKYPILPVSVMGSVGSIGETITSAQSDTTTYAYPYFVRREIDEEEMSDYLSGYEVYFPSTKSFVRGSILKLDSTYFRLKTDTWVDGAGFAVSQCVKLEDPVQVMDIITGRTDKSDYNPVTDTYDEDLPVSTTCFVEPLRQDYEFVSPSYEHIEPSDRVISVMKADATVGINTLIGDYRVISVRDRGTYVACQCRGTL